jgi:hypothetical protein
MSVMDLPEGVSDNDPLWRQGYADGNDDLPPSSDSPAYVSGWCHGHNEANQCARAESEAAYLRAAQSDDRH